MRYGVISDIHANAQALDAVLEALEAQAVDRILCLGDLVGYGADPDECVARVAEVASVCIAGNHDLIAVGRLDIGRCGRLTRQSLAWTAGRLGAETRRYLEQLPARARVDSLQLAHGSLDDPEKYVIGATAAAAELARLRAEGDPSARILLLGHTHAPLMSAEGGPTVTPPDGRPLSLTGAPAHLLNPGSVGQSRGRTARARFLVLDTDRDEATFEAVRYDTAGCRRALRRAGLPVHSHHPSSPTPQALLQRLLLRLRAD